MADNTIHFKAEFTNEMLEQIRAVVREELDREEEPVLPQLTVIETIEQYPTITAELEHEGKLYKDILYFVKDVE
jgi:hypothetical protein